jgi:DNA helicase-2/ATP-dependent DNA helicase PcrA
MSTEKEEAKKELDILLNQFRQKFSLNPKKEENKIENKNPFDIPLSIFKEAKKTDRDKEKIKKLEKISRSIESKILKEKKQDKTDKNLKLNYSQLLNKNQYLAVSTIDGSILVIAGAGSGKTRTIIYRLAYMIENDIDPKNILLLTFTRKSSNEMIKRANSLINDVRADNVMSGTFHSFANYILRKYHKILEIKPNFTIIDTSDSEDIIDLIRQELKFDKKAKAFPKKSRIQTIISKSKNCNIDISEIIEKEYKGLIDFTHEIKIIYQAYGEYKTANNILDYDDLMEFLRDSLRDNSVFRDKIQETYKYIMVDEFQDTNIVQKEIVDLIAAKYNNVMIVGDDSQSIYAFRGADVENILIFPDTYPDCKIIKLEQNYRSTQNILNFTNNIVNNSKIGYKKHLFSDIKNKIKPITKRFYSQEDEASFIVNEILKLREQNIPLDEIAILYRSSYHANFIQTELLKRNIPYVVYGGLKFTERKHVKDIISYLRVIFNPFDAVAWNRILKLVSGVGGATASKIISSIQENNGLPDPKSFKGKKFSEGLENLKNILGKISDDEIGINKKIDILKEYYEPILRMTEDDYQIRLLDIDVLYNMATNYEKLEKFLSDFALEPPSKSFQDQNNPLIDESEDKPLVLSTIHSAKGLEWNTVFVPHLLDGLLPSTNSLVSIEFLEEERRLFYVACTRAKERLFLTLPSQFTLWDAFLTHPSRFIVEVDKKNYDYM